MNDDALNQNRAVCVCAASHSYSCYRKSHSGIPLFHFERQTTFCFIVNRDEAQQQQNEK